MSIDKTNSSFDFFLHLGSRPHHFVIIKASRISEAWFRNFLNRFKFLLVRAFMELSLLIEPLLRTVTSFTNQFTSRRCFCPIRCLWQLTFSCVILFSFSLLNNSHTHFSCSNSSFSASNNNGKGNNKRHIREAKRESISSWSLCPFLYFFFSFSFLYDAMSGEEKKWTYKDDDDDRWYNSVCWES